MGSKITKPRKRKATYSCPFFIRAQCGEPPKIMARMKKSQKYYFVECECAVVHLPYNAYLKYREKFCASENVNAWKECTLAQQMVDFYEDEEKENEL